MPTYMDHVGFIWAERLNPLTWLACKLSVVLRDFFKCTFLVLLVLQYPLL